MYASAFNFYMRSNFFSRVQTRFFLDPCGIESFAWQRRIETESQMRDRKWYQIWLWARNMLIYFIHGPLIRAVREHTDEMIKQSSSIPPTNHLLIPITNTEGLALIWLILHLLDILLNCRGAKSRKFQTREFSSGSIGKEDAAFVQQFHYFSTGGLNPGWNQNGHIRYVYLSECACKARKCGNRRHSRFSGPKAWFRMRKNRTKMHICRWASIFSTAPNAISFFFFCLVRRENVLRHWCSWLMFRNGSCFK